MKPERAETRIYVQRWPEHLDLLELFYQPVVLGILPKLVLIISRLLDAFTDVSVYIARNILLFICRFMEYALDFVLIIARKTTHSRLKSKNKAPRGFYLAYILGNMLNAIFAGLNKTVFRKRPVETNFVVAIAMRERIIRDSNKIIASSVSFSLLMFGIGIIAVALYLFISR